MKEQMTIAHRGIHNQKIKENTLLSFQKAVEQNYPIELDVHLLKDGSIVVFHDDNLKQFMEWLNSLKTIPIQFYINNIQIFLPFKKY